MGQHAKRFAAGQRGTGLRAISDQLKTIADTAEEWFDPNSAEVVGAMQFFEQGLNRLSVAPAHPESEEKESPKTGRKSATPKGQDASENVSES